MPVSLFCMLTLAFIFEAGITLYWWAVKEPFFPLVNLPIFLYVAYLIGTIWIFKYTYGRFWLFITTNIILDFILIFFLIYLFNVVFGKFIYLTHKYYSLLLHSLPLSTDTRYGKKDSMD